MTIGIAAFGENAGEAILAALAAVESVGRGAIGGFVSAVALDGAASVRAETQRAGTRALRYAGSRAAFARAPLAALISSGPDRPEPLAAFVAALPGVGVVTGHRMPNAPGRDDVALNRSVIERMARGLSPREAVESVLAENRAADAGLIAMDVTGEAFAANAPSVAARPDAGAARAARAGARVLVLHNAIRPSGTLAALAAEIALDTLAPTYRQAGDVVLRAGCPLRRGERTSVVADGGGEVRELVVDGLPSGASGVVDLGYRPEVVVDGAVRGMLLYEPFLLARDGRVHSADGRALVELPVGYPVRARCHG